MNRQAERELEILDAVEEGGPLTQRGLTKRLGVALGLTNLYFKRLTRKGYIKVVDFPRKPAVRKRLRYILTPRGMAEKSRLTYEHAVYALGLYRRARATLRGALALLPEDGLKRIALYGTGDAAELAYLTLRELTVDLVGVFDQEGTGRFLGLPVRTAHDLLATDFDAVVVATFERPEILLEALVRLGVAREKIVLLRPPARSRASVRRMA